jgi:hypothetical protein
VLAELFFLITPMFIKQQILNQKWLNIRDRLEISKENIQHDTLYVGDSVGGQLLSFNGKNQLLSNGSIYAAGNYFLIKNAILNNPNINTVIYLTVPDVVGHKMARERTFNYFVKPFYTFENKKHIEESKLTMNILRKNKYLSYNLFNSIKLLRLDDYNYEDDIVKSPDSLSLESLEWLERIFTLCSNKKVKFHLASPPVGKSKKEKYNNWNKIRQQVENSILRGSFENYFNTIIYEDESNLKDNLHWKKKYIEENKGRFLKAIKSRLQ